MWRDTSTFGLAQSPVQPIAACPCCDGTVHILSLHNACLSPALMLSVASDLDAAVMCISASFSDDGEQLAVVTSDGTVLSYDTRTWQPSFKLTAGQGVMSCHWFQKYDRNQIMIALNGWVMRIDTSSGAMEYLASRWPQRKLLCMDYCGATGLIAASGNVVESDGREEAEGVLAEAALAEAPGSRDGAATDGAGTDGAASAGGGPADSGRAAAKPADSDLVDLFANTLTIAPRRGSARMRLAKAAEEVSVVGRSPIELWHIDGFRPEDE